MLPFLKSKEKSVAGLIIKMRKPDEEPKSEDSSDDSNSDAIESCAQELIRAIHAQDIKGVASALKDAFEVLSSQPEEKEEEENSISPHSYEAQNIKAGEND